MILDLKQTFAAHSGPIYNACLFENIIFTASSDRYVVGWDLTENKQTNFVVKCDTTPFSLVVAGNYLWIGLASGDIHVIDYQSKKEVKYFKQHESSVFSLIHLKNQDLVLSTDATGLVCIWDNSNLSLDASLPLDCGKIRKPCLNTDESLLLLPSQNGELRIFETKAFNEIVQLSGHSMGCNTAKFSFNEEYVYSTGKDGMLSLWDWRNEKLLISYPVHLSSVYDLLVLEKQIITCSRDKSIKIWNIEPFSIHQKIAKPGKGHTHSVNGLISLKEGFASYSDDKTLRLWGV